MLNVDRVFFLFCLFADLDEADAENWRWLCGQAAETVGRRIRDGVDVGAEMERLCTAAASVAYDEYDMLRAGGREAQEVRVGAVTVKRKSRSDAISGPGLREHFLAAVADLLERDSPFVFRQVAEERE